MKKWIAVLLPLLPVAAWAEAFSGDVEKQAVNMPAIIMFFIFVGATLYITYWAARQTKSTKDFYTAGGGISGFRNGLAIAGDYMSAASFLGMMPTARTRLCTIAARGKRLRIATFKPVTNMGII